MALYTLFTLISAAFAAAAMGSFLFLTVINKPVLSRQLNNAFHLDVYARFYRLNSVLCILSGIAAGLVNNRQTALIMAIIAVSYVFSHMHLLKGIRGQLENTQSAQQARSLASLYLLQNLIHFLQFVGTGWGVYLLSKI